MQSFFLSVKSDKEERFEKKDVKVSISHFIPKERQLKVKFKLISQVNFQHKLVEI